MCIRAIPFFFGCILTKNGKVLLMGYRIFSKKPPAFGPFGLIFKGFAKKSTPQIFFLQMVPRKLRGVGEGGQKWNIPKLIVVNKHTRLYTVVWKIHSTSALFTTNWCLQ